MVDRRPVRSNRSNLMAAAALRNIQIHKVEQGLWDSIPECNKFRTECIHRRRLVIIIRRWACHHEVLFRGIPNT